MDRRDLALLLGSMDDLGDTFARNRLMKQRENEFNLTRGDRKEESELDRAMREKEFGLRRDDAADVRAVRREGLAETGRHNKTMEQYQAEIAAAQREGNEARRTEAFFKIMGDMNKDGMLTDEGIERMSQAFNEKFGQTGLQVKIFRAPSATETEPQYHTDPESGERFATYGKTIMRSPRPMAEVKEEPGALPDDPPKRTVTRKVPVSELDREMQRREGPIDETGGPSANQQREIDSIMATPGIPAGGKAPVQGAGDRVTVISPQGKRGTIPRSQLREALSKGFKQVQ